MLFRSQKIPPPEESSSSPVDRFPRRSSAPRRKGKAKVLELLPDIPEDEAVTSAKEGYKGAT